MDIFITQLGRVVQTPIKPSSGKIKRLVKEQASTQLTEDFDHLEYRETYEDKDSGEKGSNKEHQSADKKEEGLKINSDDKDDATHLDLYV